MACSTALPAIFSASAALLALFACTVQAQTALQPYRIENDAIVQSLTGRPGDAARGREIVANRQIGLCVLCHAGPFPELRFQSNLAPDLRGVGARLNEGQLRLRVVDPSHSNPATIMPSYYRTEGLTRVTRALRGKPLLNAEQIEDVVAFLATLRE